MRYRLATLLAIGVCAMTTVGHNSLVAIGEWARRCDEQALADLGCPFDPITGRMRCPDEKTLRDAYGKVDPGELTRAGYQRLAAVVEKEAAVNAQTPEGLPEREQRRTHRATEREPLPPRGAGSSQRTASVCAVPRALTARRSTSSPRCATRTR
ncbi:hypothetical protein [Streptomyces atratus]|uniref:hypothetical protein n=1 Tax=Streptomyces atratus TaxID=1893 RepID=UPI0033DAD07B